MGKFASNAEIMDLFKDIESIHQLEIDTKQKEILINKKRNDIVMKMSFIIDIKCKKYKKFSNYEDLKQDGMVGLIKAVNRFDYTRFPNFFIYSDRWINNHILQAAKKFDVVYNPLKKKTVYYELEVPENEDLDTCPENTYYKKQRNEKMENAINELNDREKIIINSIFGINANPETLRKIGKQVNLTHERVRQIQLEVVKEMSKDQNMIEANDINVDI